MNYKLGKAGEKGIRNRDISYGGCSGLLIHRGLLIDFKMNKTTDNKPLYEDILKKLSHNILVAFFSAALLCCGLYGFVIYLHNGHIVEGQNRIIRIYNSQMNKMESAKLSLNIRDSQREKEMSAFHEEVKSLLELEYNRIQNEFEAIEIWTGVLTVIFLIFSFYSLFKTEQLENQSRDELAKLKKLFEDGQLKLGKFDANSETALTKLNTSVDEIKKNVKNQIDGLFSKGQTDALTDIDKRAKGILETYRTQIEEMLSTNQQSIEKSFDLYLKKLQSVIDKDLDMGDFGEEELDEEELNKEQENEGKEE